MSDSKRRKYVTKPGIVVEVEEVGYDCRVYWQNELLTDELTKAGIKAWFDPLPIKIADDDPRLITMLDAVRRADSPDDDEAFFAGSTWTMRNLAKTMLAAMDSLDD